jgi:hypothetical protein
VMRRGPAVRSARKLHGSSIFGGAAAAYWFADVKIDDEDDTVLPKTPTITNSATTPAMMAHSTPTT